MRRTVFVLLALTMVAAACGDDDTTPTTAATPSTEAATTTAAPTTAAPTTAAPTTTVPPEVPQVWVSNPETQMVTRIYGHTGEVLAEVAIDGRPTRMAAGAGSIWVVDCINNAVHRIDPEAAEVIAVIEVGSCPFDIDVREDFAAVVNFSDGTLSRIDTATNEVIGTLDVGPGPTGVAIGTYSVINSPGVMGLYDTDGTVVGGHDFGETSEDLFWHGTNLWAVHHAGAMSSYDPDSGEVSRYEFGSPIFSASSAGDYLAVPVAGTDTLWVGNPTVDIPFGPFANVPGVSAADGTRFGLFAVAGETGDVFMFSSGDHPTAPYDYDGGSEYGVFMHDWGDHPTAPYDYDGGSEYGGYWIGSVGPGADSILVFTDAELSDGPIATISP